MKTWALKSIITGKFLESCTEGKKEVSDVVFTEYPKLAMRFDTAIEARNYNLRVMKRVGVAVFTETQVDKGLLE